MLNDIFWLLLIAAGLALMCIASRIETLAVDFTERRKPMPITMAYVLFITAAFLVALKHLLA